MALDDRLVRESFELALEREQEFPQRCYDSLFRLHPEAKSMFGRNSPNAQRTMFAQILMAAIDHARDEAWLDRTLAELGAKHVEYGVTPDMYPWMRDSLIDALAEVCAEDWTPRHADAWREALDELAEKMLAGAAP